MISSVDGPSLPGRWWLMVVWSYLSSPTGSKCGLVVKVVQTNSSQGCHRLAREDKQLGSVVDSKSGTSGLTGLEKKVGSDWLHLHEACQQHHQAGSDLKSTLKKKERKTQEHMAHRHWSRGTERRSLLQRNEEDSPESGLLVECGRWPVLFMGQKAEVSK